MKVNVRDNESEATCEYFIIRVSVLNLNSSCVTHTKAISTVPMILIQLYKIPLIFSTDNTDIADIFVPETEKANILKLIF